MSVMFKNSSQSNLQDSASPNAVIIGLDCVTGLQTARILARHRTSWRNMTVWPGVMEEYDSLPEHVERFIRGVE